jgi:hypothetical protein
MTERFTRPLSMTVRSRKPNNAVIAWRTQVVRAWGSGPHLDTIDAVSPIMTNALDGSTSMSEALTALGHRAGFEGHPLDAVVDWVNLLVPVVPRRLRTAVRRFDNACLLADAWAAGRLAGGTGAGADRLGHLELRLGELYERCATLGMRVDREAALAVVALDGLPGCEDTRRAVLTAAEAEARRIFNAGESIVVLRFGRILVLAERDASLAFRTRRLAHAVERSMQLEGVQVRHWVEPLPADRSHLSGHLREVAA